MPFVVWCLAHWWLVGKVSALWRNLIEMFGQKTGNKSDWAGQFQNCKEHCRIKRCLCGALRVWHICIYFGKGGINQFPDESVQNTHAICKNCKEHCRMESCVCGALCVWHICIHFGKGGIESTNFQFAIEGCFICGSAWPTPPKVDLHSSNFSAKYAGILKIFQDLDWYQFQNRISKPLQLSENSHISHADAPHLRCKNNMTDQRNVHPIVVGWGGAACIGNGSHLMIIFKELRACN